MKAISKNKEILKKNPRISEKLVEKFEALDRELQKFGVDTKPKYSMTRLSGAVAFSTYLIVAAEKIFAFAE